MYRNHFTRYVSGISFSFHSRRFYAEKKSSFNHYSVLGVNSNASAKDIKAAFYRLSKKYHPDVNPNDMNTTNKFNTISNAYDVLNDPVKRREYDYEMLLKSPTSNPYVTYNRTSEYAQRARAHRSSPWKSSTTSNSFNEGFQENENTFRNSRSTSYGRSDKEQYDEAFERHRDHRSDFNNEQQRNKEASEEEENERQEKANSTVISKLILFSLCLSFGLISFFTSNLLHAMHFQQSTEEFPSRLATISKSSRQSSSKF